MYYVLYVCTCVYIYVCVYIRMYICIVCIYAIIYIVCIDFMNPSPASACSALWDMILKKDLVASHWHLVACYRGGGAEASVSLRAENSAPAPTDQHRRPETHRAQRPTTLTATEGNHDNQCTHSVID